MATTLRSVEPPTTGGFTVTHTFPRTFVGYTIIADGTLESGEEVSMEYKTSNGWAPMGSKLGPGDPEDPTVPRPDYVLQGNMIIRFTKIATTNAVGVAFYEG